MGQWVEWVTRPAPEDGIPKMDWLTSVLSEILNDDRKPDTGIKSWSQPVGYLKEPLKNRCNLKEALVFFTYCWPDGMK